LGIEAPRDMNIVREELCDPNGIVIEGVSHAELCTAE